MRAVGDDRLRRAGRARVSGLVAAAVVSVSYLIAGCESLPGPPLATRLPDPGPLIENPNWETFPAGYDSNVAILTPARWEQLVAVHRAVDREVRYATDMEAHGFEERWRLPAAGKGDCEDIALEKMRRLMALGWPRNALRIAVVRLHRPGYGETAHAALTVETDHGSLVLDGVLGAAPIAWASAPYRWIARERPEAGIVRWQVFPGAPAALPPPSCR